MSDDPQADARLGRSAARGVFWVLLTSGAGLVLSLLSQLALGWLLDPAEFGIYALAVAFAGFFQAIREGGVRLLLIQRGIASFDHLVGNAFWLALLVGTASGGLLALLSPVAAAIFDEPEVARLLLILAATLPIGSYAVVAIGKLQVELRFKTLAGLELASHVVRYTSIVLLAWAGLGAASFVIAAALVVVVENFVGFVATRLKPWRSRPSWREIGSLFQDSKWAAAGSLATKAMRRTDYFALGLVASTSVVGFYFFAYQLSFRMFTLFSESMRKVFIPAFARVTDAEQRGRVLGHAGLLVGLFVVPLPLLLVLLAPELERFLWRGRWEEAVPAIQILAIALCFELYVLLSQYVVMAGGHFRFWTALTVARGVGLFGAAFAGGMVGRASDSPATAASYIAIYLGASGLVMVAASLRRSGVRAGRFLRSSLPPPLYHAVLAAVLYLLLDSGGGRGLWPSAVVFPVLVLVGLRLLFGSQVREVSELVAGAPGGRALLAMAGHRTD